MSAKQIGQRFPEKIINEIEQSRWWLLATRASDCENAKLHGWYAEALEGPWRAHPLNPLKTDVRSARPAGRPFVKDGLLYRPAQDCSQSYGGAIVVNRLTLGPTTFTEEPVARLAPDPHGSHPHGLHTVNISGRDLIVDGRRDAFAFAHSLAVVKMRIHQLITRRQLSEWTGDRRAIRSERSTYKGS